MDALVFGAVLFAALLHAVWNAAVKLEVDRLSLVVLLGFGQALVGLAILPFAPPPAAAAWGWIAASALLHAGYKVFLVEAYRHADLSQAYPLARGTAPLLVAGVSVAALGERFAATEVLAILAISAGILLMALKGAASGGPMRGKALFFALGTACFTASYTLVDGTGARIAGGAAGFMVWMTLGDAAAMAGYVLAARGRAAFSALLPLWRKGLAVGAASYAAYWIAMWGFTQAPIALVAALRESSILFATLIAWLVMREAVGKWRWLSAGAIALGVVSMKL